MDQMNMPQDDMQDKPCATASLQDLGDVKVGDTVQMKVSAIQGDMVSLEPMDDADEDTNPQTMPLDKLEASLPKAERE